MISQMGTKLKLVCLAMLSITTAASDAPNRSVLIVFNTQNAQSKEVAAYYMKRRVIPVANACGLKLSGSLPDGGTTRIPWEQLDRLIRQPIRNCLDAISGVRILYIVLTYGTPYVIDPAPERRGRAVDQYVADLWDETGGQFR